MQPVERGAAPGGGPREPVAPATEVTAFKGLSIEWSDGLPRDETEEAVNESTLYAAGMTSLESYLMRKYEGDTKQVKEEMARIASERKAQAKEDADRMAAELAQAPVDSDEVGQSAAVVAKMKSERGQGGTAKDEGTT